MLLNHGSVAGVVRGPVPLGEEVSKTTVPVQNLSPSTSLKIWRFRLRQILHLADTFSASEKLVSAIAVSFAGFEMLLCAG